MGIGGHLSDPTLSIPLITDTLSGLFELGDMIRMRNNPNLRNLQNIGTGNANTMLREARNGGAVTPFSNMSEYTRRQIGNSDNTFKPFADSLGGIGTGKPGKFKLPDMSGGFGDVSMYDNPYQTSLDRTMSGPDGAGIQDFKPAGPGFIERAGDFLGNLLPKFETGVTSVPQTMPAVVHEGEMIVPAQMNPLAGSTPQPMAAPNAGLGAPAPLPPPPAPPAPAPVNMQPNMNLPQGGLNPQAQQLMMQRNNEQVNQQMLSQQRQLREKAATGGNIGGGDLQNQLFQSRLAADSNRNNFSRDLAITAEDRRFGDEMARADFGLRQQNTLGGLDLQRGDLDLRRQLGEGELSLANRANDQQYGLGRDRLDLDRYSTERGLGLQERSTALDERMGAGTLDLQNRSQRFDEQMGRGQLNLQNREFGLQDYLGRGQLGLQGRAQTLDERMGTGALDLQNRQFNSQDYLGRGNLALDQRNQQFNERMGQGSLDLERQNQNFQQNQQFGENRRQFDEDARIRELIASGQINLGNRGLDLQQLGQQTDTEFGQYDRQYQSFWDTLNRQDGLAGNNTQANQGSEDYIRQMLDRMFGQSGLPQAAGSGA